MVDENSANHWDELASSLGASPPAAAERRECAAPPPPAICPPKPPAHSPRPEPRRAATDWGVLASELGLPPAPVPPPQAAAPSSTPVLSPEPTPGPAPAAKAEESPNFFDERFDFEEPFDLLDAAEQSPAEAAPAAETGESAEKRKRRRRHRRRGRGGSERHDESRAVRANDALTDDAAGAADADLEAESPADELQPSADEHSSSTEAVPADELDERRRSRRRRSHRGKKRREAEPRPADENREAEVVESGMRAEATAQTDAAATAVDDGSMDDGLADDGEQPARMGFRGIPAWEEVVGMLVDKNIEVRAKRPGGGQQRGRGGRGGRRQGGDKRRS